jgi:phosphoheptose isomerase
MGVRAKITFSSRSLSNKYKKFHKIFRHTFSRARSFDFKREKKKFGVAHCGNIFSADYDLIHFCRSLSNAKRGDRKKLASVLLMEGLLRITSVIDVISL